MRSFLSCLAVLSLVLVSGCPSDPGTGVDAGRDAAADPTDACPSAICAEVNDGFTPSDSPIAVPDAFVERDAPAADDAWRDTCPMGLGMFCEDGATCPTGFECMVGRCAPQGRQLCGGFAGAMCTEPGFTACTYFSSADFGPCLTPEERRCICDDPERAEGFDCR